MWLPKVQLHIRFDARNQGRRLHHAQLNCATSTATGSSTIHAVNLRLGGVHRLGMRKAVAVVSGHVRVGTHWAMRPS